MLKKLIFIPFFLLTGANQADEFTVGQLDFFEKKIRPVLVEKCYGCHSADAEKLKADLQLDHRRHILKGGDTGPSIVPGNPEVSLLYEAISYQTPDFQMPPKGALDKETVQDFQKWIADGAAWPDETVPEKGAGKVEKFDLQKRYDEHWSWRDIKPPVPPTVSNALRVNSPIDQFILSRVEDAGLLPADPADKRTLIRRVYFDLIGLPPTPEQIATFLLDDSTDAYEHLVDKLLASPHFGEKWARHWMDLVRYAETYGHEFDYPIDFAHEYRDYLIRAYNADVPYDQFVVEHIAGDLIEQPRRHPLEEFNESILATAFWYFHEATHAPTDVLQDEADHMDNQLDVFGKSFLGLTVACARCHDHKFDAISTADYYALTTYLQSSARQEYPMDPGREREKAVGRLKKLGELGVRALKKVPADKVRKNLPGEYLKAAADLIRGEIDSSPSGDPWQGTVFDDFESDDFEKWKITGNAFGKRPTGAVRNQKLEGDFGKRLANSYHNGNDKDRGTLTSEKFVIERPYINFLIAGGGHKNTAFEIWIDGKLFARTSGRNTDKLEVRAWNVSSQTGKTGELRIIDNARGGWGHIEVDRIVFSDVPAASLESLSSPDQKTIETYARSRNLNPDKLRFWTNLFTSSEKDDKKPGGFFRRIITSPAISKGIVSAQKRIQEGNSGFKKDATLIASFVGGNEPKGWSTSGYAYQPPKDTVGISFDPLTPFSVPGVYSSSLLGTRQTGVLRSPTFEITDGYIFVKAKCDNLFARVVIDNYHMAKFSGLLFGGTIEKDLSTDGEYRWFSFKSALSKYIGHNAFLEFVDKGGATAEIAEIWMSKESALQSDIHPAVTAASGEGCSSIDEIAANLDSAWTSAWDSIRKGKSLFSEIALLNWMVENDLFQISDLSLNLSEILEEGYAINESLPAERYALAMAEGSPEDGHVYIRGSHRKTGERVTRRMLTALGGKEGDRLELARQIAAPENPLTSRVIVNRIWHHIFGRGIVASVDDFGPMGQQPSHPELLDWLAADFTSHGWSVKRAIRQILLSNTYRQSSVVHPELDLDYVDATDPNNILLHRMPVRRLQAEAIRDSILAVTGGLDLKMFGPSVPTHRTKFMSGRGARGSGPLDGNGRRSIYGAVYRNFLSPLMLSFDQPGPFGPKGRRSVSNVPAQALALMNDPFIIEQTRAWAKESAEQHESVENRIEYMYEKAIGAKPVLERTEALKAFLEQQSRTYGKFEDERAWADLGHVLINMKDFIYLN